MTRPFRCIGPQIAALALVLALALPAAAESSGRPPAWAAPLSEPGLPNLHRVDEGVYRGAQPTARGFRRLEALGVRTVVNLRALHSDRDELRGTSLRHVHIRFNPAHAELEDVVAFLSVVTDPAARPVFFHCQHGADRTGTMAAIYRVAVQGWDRDEAIREMTEGGFGFHAVWRNLPAFLRKLDFDPLRKRFGRR